MRYQLMLWMWMATASVAFARPGDGDNFSEPSGGSSGSSASSASSASSSSSPGSRGTSSPRGILFTLVGGVVLVVFVGIPAYLWHERQKRPFSVYLEGSEAVNVKVDFTTVRVDPDESAMISLIPGKATKFRIAPFGVVTQGVERAVDLFEGMELKVSVDGRVWTRPEGGEWRQAGEAGPPPPPPPAPPPPATPLPSAPDTTWVDPIRARDAAFDAAGFQTHVRHAIAGVYDAWNRGNADALRPWTSDGVYNRFATQIALRAAKGLRNEARDLRIEHVVVIGATHGRYDAIDVRVTLACTDVDVRIDTGAVARPARLDKFQEIWTFLRRSDAVTKHAEGHCPSCGSSLGEGAVIRCAACGSLVNNGRARWVLAEITQPQARVAKPSLALPGEISAAEVEDRASTCFWAWLAAGHHVGNALPLLATSPFAPAPVTYESPGVGAVVLRDVTIDGTAAVAKVELRWTGTPPGGSRTTSTWWMTLRREAGAAADARGLATLACAACGGPCDRTDAPACGYCGASRAPAAADWVMTALSA